MSYQVPTLGDLLDRSRKAFRKYLPGSDAWIWPNNIGPTCKAFAGGAFEVFGFAAHIAKMIFVHSAPDLDTLKMHAAEYGMAQRPAYPAGFVTPGVITITADDDVSVAQGAIFERTDGFQYIAQLGGARVGPGTLNIPIMALTDGASGNAAEGTPMIILSGVTAAGTATAEISTGLSDGADEEDMESFRARILFRKRYPPHGGAAADYVMWASEVSGVSRVYVERLWAGAGTVRVFVLMDELYPNGIPTAPAVERVIDHIEAVRPAGAIVTVAAPQPKTVDVQIKGFSPDTVAGREAAISELRAAFLRLSRVAGVDTPHGGMPFLATPATFSRSWIWQAIANAVGEERHEVVLPGADVPLNPGEIPVLGTVTFIP